VSPTRAEPDVIGRTVSHYRVLERLGGGGMGVVFKAEDTRLNRQVALKFLPIELTRDPEAKARFLNEARAASALDHPHICTVHEIDETPDGHSFICMSFYEGESLKRRLERGPLEVADAVRVAAQVADGLAKAHAQGILHRDIKPANVMVTTDGVAKIIDFGLAKLAGEAHLTRAGVAMGTASYMSPEQAQGRPVDGRTDVWSLGVLLFQSITGELPFRGDNEQAIMYAIVHEPHVSLRALAPDLPEALVAIVERCLDKNPDRRFATAGELRIALRQVLHALPSGELTTITTATPISAHGLSARRRRGLWRAAAVAGALVVVVAAGLLLRGWLATPPLPADKHIVVLDVRASGGDVEGQAFADGLLELIASKLARLEAKPGESRWVVPPAETWQRKITTADQARREVGATIALTARVNRQGETARVELALLDAASGRELRAVTVEDRLANLPVFQDEATVRLGELLGARPSSAARQALQAGDTPVPAAFEACLRGRGALQRAADLPQLDRAIEVLTEATIADPVYALAFAGLADAYRRKAELGGERQWAERSLAAARRAVAADPGFAAAQVALGSACEALGEYREAIGAYAEAVRLDGQAVENYWRLAHAWEQLGEPEKAADEFQKAIYLRPDYWACYNALGFFYHRQGRYEAAVTQFRRVVEVTPENPRGYNNLGGLYMYLGRWPEAREVFERTLSIGAWPASYSNLGTLYFLDSRFSDAAKMYEKALESDKNDYVLWGNLGNAYRHGGQTAKAASADRRAIELAEAKRSQSPDDRYVVIDLAGYHAVLGDRDKGLALLNQVLAAPIEEPDLMAEVGMRFEDLGDRERAIEWIARALEHGYSRSLLEVSPAFRELRADPRVAKLLEDSSTQSR